MTDKTRCTSFKNCCWTNLESWLQCWWPLLSQTKIYFDWLEQFPSDQSLLQTYWDPPSTCVDTFYQWMVPLKKAVPLSLRKTLLRKSPRRASLVNLMFDRSIEMPSTDEIFPITNCIAKGCFKTVSEQFVVHARLLPPHDNIFTLRCFGSVNEGLLNSRSELVSPTSSSSVIFKKILAFRGSFKIFSAHLWWVMIGVECIPFPVHLEDWRHPLKIHDQQLLPRYANMPSHMCDIREVPGMSISFTTYDRWNTT